MDPEKNTSSNTSEPEQTPASPTVQPSEQAPADALSRTPEDLHDESLKNAASAASDEPVKKISPVKAFFKRINVYLLMFLLILVIAIAASVVLYLNSIKTPPVPTISSQSLAQDALKQLKNTDATVGNTSQTLTIQGNAIIAGQTLARGNLNVAGNIQSGGSLQSPTLSISGQSNLGATQINSLQVATNAAIQGSLTLRDVNVAGTSSFSGPLTASQITVTNLILSGNATLQVPNHIAFTGPTPSRSSGNALGNGGTTSISGSDTAGTINVNTGNSPVAGCFAQVTFSQRFTNQPHVLVTPIGAAAGQTNFYVIRSNTGFSVCGNTPAPANQVFGFDYFVTN